MIGKLLLPLACLVLLINAVVFVVELGARTVSPGLHALASFGGLVLFGAGLLLVTRLGLPAPAVSAGIAALCLVLWYLSASANPPPGTPPRGVADFFHTASSLGPLLAVGVITLGGWALLAWLARRVAGA